MFQLTSVKYQNIIAIDHLHIKDQIATSIIGESGIGKSTLLKLLNRMISPDEGEILYKDQSIESYDPVELRREVSMLSQQPATFEGTIQDNLNLGLAFAEKPFVRPEDMKYALKIVKLNKNLDTPALKLSGGEQQRLALARIILLHPRVLLLDEPTSALDSGTEDIVMDQFLTWAKSTQTSIIMVTHSEALADKYSDETIKMVRLGNPKVITHE